MVVTARREDYRWALHLGVRWGDMDVLGHVNNARYMTYAESARLAYFEPLMGDESAAQAVGGGLILANISCDFLEQLRYPADIEVGSRVSHIGRSSLTMEQTIFEGQRAVAQLHSIIVWFDYTARTAMPVPEQARAYIAEREGNDTFKTPGGG